MNLNVIVFFFLNLENYKINNESFEKRTNIDMSKIKSVKKKVVCKDKYYSIHDILI